MDKIAIWGPSMARIVMGLFYWVMAAGLIKDFEIVTRLMAVKGVPLQAPLLAVTIAVWVLGGLALMLNWNMPIAAMILFAITFLVTPVMHNFWAAPPEMFASELQHFFKNLAILGGLIAIAAISRLPGAG